MEKEHWTLQSSVGPDADSDVKVTCLFERKSQTKKMFGTTEK
jgi:hypothetical protein